MFHAHRRSPHGKELESAMDISVSNASTNDPGDQAHTPEGYPNADPSDPRSMPHNTSSEMGALLAGFQEVAKTMLDSNKYFQEKISTMFAVLDQKYSKLENKVQETYQQNNEILENTRSLRESVSQLGKNLNKQSHVISSIDSKLPGPNSSAPSTSGGQKCVDGSTASAPELQRILTKHCEDLRKTDISLAGRMDLIQRETIGLKNDGLKMQQELLDMKSQWFKMRELVSGMQEQMSLVCEDGSRRSRQLNEFGEAPSERRDRATARLRARIHQGAAPSRTRARAEDILAGMQAYLEQYDGVDTDRAGDGQHESDASGPSRELSDSEAGQSGTMRRAAGVDTAGRRGIKRRRQDADGLVGPSASRRAMGPGARSQENRWA